MTKIDIGWMLVVFFSWGFILGYVIGRLDK